MMVRLSHGHHDVLTMVYIRTTYLKLRSYLTREPSSSSNLFSEKQLESVTPSGQLLQIEISLVDNPLEYWSILEMSAVLIASLWDTNLSKLQLFQPPCCRQS